MNARGWGVREVLMRRMSKLCLMLVGGLVVACGESSEPLGPRPDGGVWEEAGSGASASDQTLVYRSDVQPVTRVEQAQPGTFIPPFEECREPIDGDRATRADGKVCTN